MPTFDFVCGDCGEVFEFSRPFGSKEVPPCPACGSTKTEKRIAPPSIHFRGEGFYKTDSRKDAAATADAAPAAEEKAAPKPAEKAPEAQKDSKKAGK